MAASEAFEPANQASVKAADGAALNQHLQAMTEPHRGIVSARESSRMPAPPLVPKSSTPVPEPKADPPSRDAIVRKDAAGTLYLQPYPGQLPLRDYPGGKGSPQDVDDARKVINQIPGPTGAVAREAFDLFDKNYRSRVGENKTPTLLALTDVTAKMAEKVTDWQLHYDVDLYNKEIHGPLGARDLRPNTDKFPGGGKMPKSFFAVGFDAQGKPLDVLKYDDPGTGSRYLGQYRIQYDDLTDGSGMHRVTVKNWVDADMNKPKITGPQEYIGNRLNTLAGVTQYYYDSAGHCVDAQYYTGATLQLPPNQWVPTDEIKYPNGQAYQSTEERQRASRMDFFDTFGPRLPEIGK